MWRSPSMASYRSFRWQTDWSIVAVCKVKLWSDKSLESDWIIWFPHDLEIIVPVVSLTEAWTLSTNGRVPFCYCWVLISSSTTLFFCPLLFCAVPLLVFAPYHSYLYFAFLLQLLLLTPFFLPSFLLTVYTFLAASFLSLLYFFIVLLFSL